MVILFSFASHKLVVRAIILIPALSLTNKLISELRVTYYTISRYQHPDQSEASITLTDQSEGDISHNSPGL